MPRLTRVQQKIFGAMASAGQIAQFGSLAAGIPTTTTDPAVVQSLSNFLVGWFAAVLGENSPAIEDMNALFFLITRQIAYVMESGVPEWDTDTTYFLGDFVNVDGYMYASIADDNLGNAVTDTTQWVPFGGSLKRAINEQSGTAYTFALTDGSHNRNSPIVFLGNAADILATVPSNASVPFPIGTEIDVIQTDDGRVTFNPDTGVTIESYTDALTLIGKNTKATLLKTGINTWKLTGQITHAFIQATGGTITTDGDYKVHTFTSSGNFVITQGAGNVRRLLTGGGGGGGHSSAGGGGAGEFIDDVTGVVLGVGTYPVVLGDGGLGGNPASTFGQDGGNTTATGLTALGGGGGGYDQFPGRPGGSGGGGGGGMGGQAGGAGSAGGNAGGTGDSSGNNAGGGGGGAGGVGGNASTAQGGDGGLGMASDITGASVFYCSGGGGATSVSGQGAAFPGGGAPGLASAASDATPNTGGGGGARGDGSAGSAGRGGKAVTIFRYKFQ